MPEPVRCVVVDDEAAARAMLQELIEPHDALELVGSFGDPVTALEALNDDPPELLFLDIDMPRLNGFELLTALDVDRLPIIVFVTAYDEYAIHAFDVAALDYLLKPIEEGRFAATIDRALAAHMERSADGGSPYQDRADVALRQLLHKVTTDRTDYVQRLPVKIDGSRIRLLAVSEIESIEPEGNYARLHAGGHSFLMRESMVSLEKRLDPAQFARVHRGQMVNIESVVELEPLLKGEYVLVLRSGRQVTSGRTFRERVRDIFQLG